LTRANKDTVAFPGSGPDTVRGMGVGPSRSLTMKNPEPPGKIIQITEDVARRMTSRHGGKSPAAEEQQGAKTESEYRKPESQPQTSSQVPQQGLLNVGAKGFPVVETVTAYEVRRQKEEELRQNDEFWTSKLKDLEARYVAAAFAAEGVFNKELEKLDKLVPKPKEPVCQDYTHKVAQCYKENSSQALKCSDVVREFALCVERQGHSVSAPVV